MDVNEEAVEHLMAQHHVQTLIHGHTHRPALHTLASGQRWVLPDWYQGHGGYLSVQEQNISMHLLDGSVFGL
jgi:UDP-2,3-diacylglucosamine hydrolase